MELIVYFALLLIVLILIIFGIRIGMRIGELKANKKWENSLPKIRSDSIKKSREVMGGQFSEQLAPFLPDFPFSPTECRFLGKPVDLIVFKGMDSKEIQEVVFVEIKSGDATLSSQERKLRDCIKEKKISWEEYRIPRDMTQ